MTMGALGPLKSDQCKEVSILTAAVKFIHIIIILNFTSVCESLVTILITSAFPDSGLNKKQTMPRLIEPARAPTHP